MRLSSTCRSTRRRASSAPSGSSSSSTGGCRTIARASATRCCWPPESWPGRRSSIPPSWTMLHRLAAPAAPAPPWCSAGSAGRRPRCRPRSGAGTARRTGRPCSPRRLCGGRLETSSPSSRIAPSSSFSNPAISRSVVVLPQPDGPSIVKNSPPGISMSTPADGEHLAVALDHPLEPDLAGVAHAPAPVVRCSSALPPPRRDSDRNSSQASASASQRDQRA